MIRRNCWQRSKACSSSMGSYKILTTRPTVIFVEIQFFDRGIASLAVVAQRSFGPAFLQFFYEVRAEDSAGGKAMGTGVPLFREDVASDRIWSRFVLKSEQIHSHRFAYQSCGYYGVVQDCRGLRGLYRFISACPNAPPGSCTFLSHASTQMRLKAASDSYPTFGCDVELPNNPWERRCCHRRTPAPCD
jgi:hypothetical protein